MPQRPMARSQVRKDKERFFADLDRLCESDQYSDDEVIPATSKPRLPLRVFRPHTEADLNIFQGERVNKSHEVSSIVNAESLPPDRDPESTRRGAQSNLALAVSTQQPPKRRKGNSYAAVNKQRDRWTESEIWRGGRVNKSKQRFQLVPEEKQVFKNLVFFFVPNDDVAKPRKNRILNAREHGAQRVTSFSDVVTHVIVEPNIDYQEAAKAFPKRQIPEGAVLVKSTWLIESLTSMFLRDPLQSRFQVKGVPSPSVIKQSSKLVSLPYTAKYRFEQPNRPGKMTADTPSDVGETLDTAIAQVKNVDPPIELDLEDSKSLSSAVQETSFDSVSPSEHKPTCDLSKKENKGFICMDPSGIDNGDNPNSKTIGILQEMAEYYDSAGDHWRTTAYRKAISVLRKQTTLVGTRDQALCIPQIGSRLADKIEEVVTTNQLRRLENVRDDPRTRRLRLFTGIYGVGYKQASRWIAEGYSSLADLLEKADLTVNQRIGIEHYDDFQQRIPRVEVSQHAAVVQRACHAIDNDLRVIIGGSYRRGNATSGDIDLIITKPGVDMSHICSLITSSVIPVLIATGFLKCVLASSTSHGDNSTGTTDIGSKWHGASCLPSSTSSTAATTTTLTTPWRRIDLLFVPGDELGAALLYFTGDDIFNRSMRLLARKRGMCLNQHGLYSNIIRGDDGCVKMNSRGSLLVEGASERRIFEVLGVPWREPWERKCC